MKKTIYKDAQGRRYVVMSNAGIGNGKPMYCAYMEERKDGVLHSNIPQGLSWRKSWTAAQKDLDKLAKKNGWKPWYGN